MIEHEDALMRPVLRGMVRFESLLDGSISLADLMLCNEAIDVENENNRRAQVYEEARLKKERASGR